jgi:hypothetical protein
MPVQGPRSARQVRQTPRQALRRSIRRPPSWARRPRARQLLPRMFVAKPRESRPLRSKGWPEQLAKATGWIRPTRLWSKQELSTGKAKKPNAWIPCDAPKSSPGLVSLADERVIQRLEGVFTSSTQRSGRGFAPRNASGTLQLSTRCSSMDFPLSRSFAVRAASAQNCFGLISWHDALPIAAAAQPQQHSKIATTRPKTSGPIPKFARARLTFRCELRNLRTTSNFMILVRF